MPDVARSACIVVWGSNPNGNFLTLATDIAAAKARGARLLVVGSRRVGSADQEDVWLQVRPGTDGALALGLIHLLIRDGSYDIEFVREWTNAPFLVRDDTGMLLTGADLDGVPSTGRRHVAAIEGSSELVVYDAERGVYAMDARLALRGARTIRLADGREVTCRPVFERLTALAADYEPATVARITGATAEKVNAPARLRDKRRPSSH